MFRKLIRRFIAWRVNKESEKFERFSSPWAACLTVGRVFNDEYEYK